MNGPYHHLPEQLHTTRLNEYRSLAQLAKDSFVSIEYSIEFSDDGGMFSIFDLDRELVGTVSMTNDGILFERDDATSKLITYKEIRELSKDKKLALLGSYFTKKDLSFKDQSKHSPDNAAAGKAA